MDEAQFLTAVNLIADKHGMSVTVDFGSHVIDFFGEGDEVACAIELEDVLGRWSV